MNEDHKILLVKYITGQADESECSEIKRWIKACAENEAYYIEMYEAWHASLLASDAINVNEAYNKFITGSSSPLKTSASWKKIAIAASFLCVCAIGLYKVKYNVAEDAFVKVAVEKGQTKKLILPDGSIVWINAGTELKYSKAFGTTDRTVYLNGEAYFDIANNKNAIPFLVKTAKFTIRDIGTIFNVKAYSDEKIFEASVIEGEISVEDGLKHSSSEDDKVYVGANQVVKIDASPVSLIPENGTIAHIKPEVVDINKSQQLNYNGWKDDILVFEEDTFEEIVTTLGRKYNVDIIISDEELKTYKYTGTFKNIQDVLKVLKVISENTPITYTQTGTLITISKTDITNQLN